MIKVQNTKQGDEGKNKVLKGGIPNQGGSSVILATRNNLLSLTNAHCNSCASLSQKCL